MLWSYSKKDKMLKVLIKTSHIPIKFIKMESGELGRYYHRSKLFSKDLTVPRIEIKDDLEDYKKIAVLIHEKAHSICDEKNCSCLKNPDHTEREIHAYMYELRWLLKYKREKGLKWLVNRLMDFVDDSDGCYSKAAEHIIKTELWQKCLDYVK